MQADPTGIENCNKQDLEPLTILCEDGLLQRRSAGPWW